MRLESSVDARDLKVFEAVARLGGMNKAAIELKPSNPTLQPALGGLNSGWA